ncbi:MAG TPA: hypothetical protein VLL51_04320, partial [Gemmatimonadales bacterium]|nr:hypothetical protein [Gemmatimonadales bacterium]
HLAPMAPCETPMDGQKLPRPEGASSYRPWAQLLARTFAVDVLACPRCHGRMRLLALVQDPANVARYLAAGGEATEVAPRSPGRGPPYWKSRVLRRQALGEEDDAKGRWVQGTSQRGSRTQDGATGRRSLRLEPGRGHPASSPEGPASQPRAAGVGNRPGWSAPRQPI